MSSTTASMLEKFEMLSPDRQQQILEFMEFLATRSIASSPRSELSALDLAGDIVGSVQGASPDLAQKHLGNIESSPADL